MFRPSGTWVQRVIFLGIAGLAIHLFLPQFVAFQQTAAMLRAMYVPLILLAAAAEALSYFGSGYILASGVRAGGTRLSLRWSTLIATVGSSVGTVAGGAFGYAASVYHWLRQRGVSAEAAGVAGWLPTFFNNVLLVALAGFGLSHLLITRTVATWQLVTFGVTLGILIVTALVFLIGARHEASLTSHLEKALSRWHRFRKRPHDPQTVSTAVARTFAVFHVLPLRKWGGPAMGAAFNVGCDMLTLYLVFRAAGYAVGLDVFLAGYGLPLLLGKAAFFLPGGIGVIEATMAALYGSLGVPGPTLVVVVLVYRLLSFWAPTALGFAGLFLLRAQPSEK